MSRSKKVFIAGVSLILALVVLLGCLPNKQGGFTCIAAPLISKIKSMLPSAKKSSPAATTGPTRPHPPVRTGTIATGTKTQAASQSIDSSGGTIAVNKPGDLLDGFVIDVPAKSYTDGRTFKVSSAPITNHSFGKDINPVSPLITVESGGAYSDEVMYIRVPVKVPEGKFAMGFLYDEKSKQLEGMPLVGSDADSITVATQHFSSFFISMIEDALLKKNIDSGFRPGIDDWQFDNNGSYIAPGGHCSGQSIAAMWYYYAQPDGKDACLYKRYDNNGNQPETPALWQDDSLGYRFCSTIHCDYEDSGMWGTSLKWDALAGIGWKKENNQWKRIDGPGISDASTWRLFAYSIQASGQPQYVSINSNAGGWHAMICYAVSENNTLCIADPNYHGREDRKIEFVDNKFKPYNSGADAEEIAKGHGKAYEKIIYRGAWTIMPYDKIAQRWIEFNNKTIGNDRFPAYTIQYKDSKGLWQELKDGYISQEKLINIQASFESEGGGSGVYRDGAKLPNGPKELKPGNNLLGIYIAKDVADYNYKYVDFKYINVIYGSLSIDPATLDGELNKQYAFTAKADSPPAGARYDWYVDGSKVQSNTSTSYSASFKTEGSHKVSVKLVDGAGKEIQEAAAAVSVKAATSGKWVLDGAPVINNQMHTDDRFNKLIKAEIKQGSATYNVNHIHSDGHVMGTTKADFTFTEAPGELVPGSNVKFTVSGEYSGTGTCYPVTCRVTSEEIADTAAHTYFGCYVAISDTDKKKVMTNLAFIPTKDEFNKGKLHFIYLLDGPAGSQTITYTYK